MITKIDKLVLRQTIENIDKLSKGIDPTTDIVFDKDTILNQKQVQRLLTDACDYLSIFYHSENIDVKTRKIIPFYLSEAELSRISPLSEEIAISKFAYYINSIISRPEMKSLKATQITTWLVEQGLLKIIEGDQHKSYKVVTEKGSNLGIRTEERTNSLGISFPINLYSTEAQTFLLENLILITENNSF